MSAAMVFGRVATAVIFLCMVFATGWGVRAGEWSVVLCAGSFAAFVGWLFVLPDVRRLAALLRGDG